MTSSGLQANASSFNVDISADGRYVVFLSSFAFVVEDTNGTSDVYIRDTVLDTTELVSWNSSNTEAGNNISLSLSISADGRFVAFASRASDIIVNDTNGFIDVFVRDLVTNSTELISSEFVSGGGIGAPANGDSFAPSISADGRYVAYATNATNYGFVIGDSNGTSDVVVRDRVMEVNHLVSIRASGGFAGNFESSRPSISADGRFVAFNSVANDLVVGDTNGSNDIFVRDLVTDSTELVSLNRFNSVPGNDGSASPSISANGRFVAFNSVANDLVVGDTNGSNDIFVRDLVMDTTELVSINSSGESGNGNSSLPSISSNGRFVAFTSTATDLELFTSDTNAERDVFWRDRDLNTTLAISLESSLSNTGNAQSSSAAISADGGFIAYQSDASDLVQGDTNVNADIFLFSLEGLIGSGPIVSATLPVSRSVQVGNQATAFASIINTHPSDGALNCTLLPFTDIPADFAFQPTDEMGMLIGEQNQGADIASLNGVQGYVFAYIPTEAFAPTDVEITYDCANTDPAENTVGLNTFLLSASDTPVPDIIGITTVTDLVAAQNTTSLFAVGSTNVGITEDITVNIDTGSTSLPLNLLVCQTNPSTGACLPGSPPSATTTFTYTASSNASFAIFVEPTAAISNDPANNRIFIRFTDGGGTVRGATSTAVRTM